MMLLKRLLVFFGFVTASCASGSTTQDIDDILAGHNYTFEFAYEGCFGGGTETIVIQDKNIAIYTFPVFGEADRIKEKVDTFFWTGEKEALLREICLAGIQFSDTLGSCTTTTQYELTGSSKSITFTDRNCALTDAIERLVK
ncbi:hypothetical protein [Dawidia soli]|uniref:Uncharacterized protein n=1 Tax=Dawidia soli TaxID=2782352 RepID=A0AAP2GDA4_9BACT|nr:hypothetical protein [Dawidia soli]MBT1687037.1 hypothetical protein [Dawidia soli]